MQFVLVVSDWSSKNQSWNKKTVASLEWGGQLLGTKMDQHVQVFFSGVFTSMRFFQEQLSFPPKKNITTRPTLSIPIPGDFEEFETHSFSSNMGHGSIVTSLPIPAIIRFLQPSKGSLLLIKKKYIYTRRPGRSPTLKHTPCAVSVLFAGAVFWRLGCFCWTKCYGMDCFGTYFTHAQTCNVTRV